MNKTTFQTCESNSKNFLIYSQSLRYQYLSFEDKSKQNSTFKGVLLVGEAKFLVLDSNVVTLLLTKWIQQQIYINKQNSPCQLAMASFEKNILTILQL